MNDTNNEQLIAWIKILMICGGVWNQPISKNCFIQNVFNVYSVLMRSSWTVFWILLIAELIRLAMGNYPLPIVISSLGVVITATKVVAKTIIYMKYHLFKMFKDVIEKEREVWKSNEEIKKIYRAKILICRLYIGALTIGTFMAVLFLVVNGAFSTVQIKQYNEVHNETLESHYMYMVWFPRDNLKDLTLTISLQVLWGWAAVTYNSFTHLFFATLLIYSASRLEILQVKLRNYIEPGFGEEPNMEQMKEKITVLKSLIVEHKYIIGFIGNLNAHTKNIIMMEFILSSLDMASVSISLIKMDASQIAWLFCFFILLGMQMLVLAWSCNEIYIQSAAIADALYESKWYLLNKEGRQLTQIMIARAQRPLAMTIGLFGPMTNQAVILDSPEEFPDVRIMFLIAFFYVIMILLKAVRLVDSCLTRPFYVCLSLHWVYAEQKQTMKAAYSYVSIMRE